MQEVKAQDLPLHRAVEDTIGPELSRCSWLEVERYLARGGGIIVPVGSTEQHGPIGLIGTDAICAEVIAIAAARAAGGLVAPTITYAPAPFNSSFPGTVSISNSTFRSLVEDVLCALFYQGFDRFYFLNGHGANLDILISLCSDCPELHTRIRSWWQFEDVDRLRQLHFGEWEGMHATPSEVSIAEAVSRVVYSPMADHPPERLSRDYIKRHSGDRHGPPEEHRASFPDGRVGSHSALARPQIGHELLNAAAAAVADDYLRFMTGMNPA